MVPGGQVDSTTTSEPLRSTGAIDAVAARAAVRSGSWCGPNGVGTAMMNASAGSGSSEARSAPLATTPESSAARSGSTIGERRSLTAVTVRSETS